MPRKSTTEEFIEKAKIIHNDKYKYDKVVYINNKTKVSIYCKECNKYFSQTPNDHLRFCGCPYCAGNKLKTQEQFIEKAIEKHGDKYEYDRVVYINNRTKISIYCKKCKEYFWQKANSHLQGIGCKQCGIEIGAEKKSKTKEQFIIDAIKVHGKKYCYNFINYINCNTNVKIYCNKCKKYFSQTPDKHLNNRGCPICRESKGEIEIRKYLEKYNIHYITQKRFSDCRNKNPLPFDLYLPDFNICIEYQGEQHYSLLTGYIHKKFTLKEQQNNFKRQQKHDKIKRDYCLKNNIQLIEIPYWDFKKIEEYIVNINTNKEVMNVKSNI